MEITITDGTNAKGERVTRIRVEVSDHDLATVNGDPDELLKVVKRSRNRPFERLCALATLASKIKVEK